MAKWLRLKNRVLAQDDDQTVAFIPIVNVKWSDWMRCPACGVTGWCDVIPTTGQGFYHKCCACGARIEPPEKAA